VAVNVNMRLIFAIPIILVSGYCIPTVLGNHLPEDKLRDDGVALVREKRDNFIDRILKSIPFFHMGSPANVLEEEPVEPFDDDEAAADDDDDDDGATPALSAMPATAVTSSFAPLRSSMVLSASVPISSTPWTDELKQSVVMSTDSIVSITSSPSTAAMIQTSPAILNSVEASLVVGTTSSSMGTRELLNSFMNANAPMDAILNFTSAPSASIASLMSASGVMAPSRSSIATTVSMATDDSEPVIKMMIMSGEPELRVQDYGARLPDERGFVDGLGRQGVGEDIDVKVK
jgi:hypothetical protein